MNPKKKAFLMPIAKRTQAKLIANATPAEQCFKMMLIRAEIPFKFQYILWTYTSFFVADFIVESKTGKKYLVELDGSVHFNRKAKKKDRNRSSIIRQKGYGVLRLNNSDVLRNPEKVKKKLKRFGVI